MPLLRDYWPTWSFNNPLIGPIIGPYFLGWHPQIPIRLQWFPSICVISEESWCLQGFWHWLLECSWILRTSKLHRNSFQWWPCCGLVVRAIMSNGTFPFSPTKNACNRWAGGVDKAPTSDGFWCSWNPRHFPHGKSHPSSSISVCEKVYFWRKVVFLDVL